MNHPLAPFSAPGPDAHDATIDRVLTALRDSQPAPELERRVLAAVQARAASPRWSWRKAFPAARPFPAYALALMLAVVALGVWISIDAGRTKRPDSSPVPAVNGIPQTARTILRSSPVPPNPAQRNPALPEPKPSRSSRAGGATLETRLTPSVAPPAASLSPLDALALDETTEPSHPAPDLPLTAQEKLMLRIVRRHNSRDLAALDSLARDQQLASDQAQFQQFFDLFIKGDKNENDN